MFSKALNRALTNSIDPDEMAYLASFKCDFRVP